MTASVGTKPSGVHSAARLAPGFQLGDYRIGQPLWPLRIADAYKAEGPKGPATLYVIHARVAQTAVRDHVIAGTRTAAALPEQKHLVRTLAAGLTGDVLWIATEEIEGQLVRDLMLKKRQAGNAGLGVRAAGNLVVGVAAALVDTPHGALDDESVVVSRTGRVRVIDLALGAGTLAAMTAGLIPAQSNVAPELLSGSAPNGASDVYAVGALLYQALVGSPLERGGPRPSDVVADVNTQIDEIVARACHREADKRFGRVDVLGEVVAEALGKGGAVMTTAVPKIDLGPGLDQQVSLSTEIAAQVPSVSGNAVVDRALASALADTTEKWLITKNKMDYGPFSLADVITQIEKGEIVAGAVIQDKDSGARSDIGTHPLLGPMVEQARQQRDDSRRAQAEVKAQSSAKKRGAALYGVIGLGVLGAAAAVFFIIKSVESDSEKKGQTVSALDGASLKVKVSEPKKPVATHHKGTGGTHHTGGGNTGGGNFQNTGENLALDLSDDSDETETLDMGTVYGVYSKYGGKLGGCLQSSGESSANIGIIIDGPSGHVTWVKVNGKQAGGLYGCLSGALRSMQFPKIHGPRTRAEFDISM